MASWSSAATTLLALVVTLLVAHFSSRWFESRFIRLGHSVKYAEEAK
jgi:peptidoglycan/LPS O-acetylase OafA/YrhL